MSGDTIGLFIAIIGCFVGLAGWLSGRDKKISNDAEWKGTVNAKLDMILVSQRDTCSDVDKLTIKVEEHSNRITTVEASLKSLHHRLDDNKPGKG